MPGFFQSKRARTRIETCADLKQPLYLINQLRSKETELRKSSKEKGPSSVDYRKHLVISTLLTQIDKVIADFNESKSELKAEDETTDVIKFVRTLSALISTTRNEEDKTLLMSRNKTRERVSDAVYYGTFGATLIAASALTLSTVGKFLTLVYVAPGVSKKIWVESGLDDLSPKSVRILNKLTKALDDINQNLTKKINPQLPVNENESEDFICPILQTVMKDPMLCTLDGHNYEKYAIEQWFSLGHKTSPLDPSKKIPFDKKPKDVLVKDYNFKDVLERYRREHPFVDEEEKSIEVKLSV